MPSNTKNDLSEVDSDFPLLHGQSTIAMWSSLEAWVRSFVANWLANEPEAWQAEAVQKLKIRLGELELPYASWHRGGRKAVSAVVAGPRAERGLLKKVRSNATWNGLSGEKRATLEHWLFEEGLSYNTALERAKSELGFTGSRTSLRRFYEHARSQRLLSGLTDTGNLARTVEESDVSVERLRNAGLKLAAEMFLRSVAASPENMKEWAPLAKLLLQAERNESWRRIKEEENEIRERSLELARERFQYATINRAMKALPELNELDEARRDPELTELEENKRINDIRRGMFGPNIPGVLPETEEELAHPEILKAKEKEAWARQMAIYARQREEREREEKAIKNEKLKVQNTEERSDGVLVENGPAQDGGKNEDERVVTEPEERPVEEGVYYPGGGK
jgi:hypothetical protein